MARRARRPPRRDRHPGTVQQGARGGLLAEGAAPAGAPKPPRVLKRSFFLYARTFLGSERLSSPARFALPPCPEKESFADEPASALEAFRARASGAASRLAALRGRARRPRRGGPPPPGRPEAGPGGGAGPRASPPNRAPPPPPPPRPDGTGGRG